MLRTNNQSKDPPSPNEINRLIHEPARFQIMSHLYVIESAEALFLQRQTGLTWGNLASHLNKLETAGYITIKKDYVGKKPHTMLHLTDKGRTAFKLYHANMIKVLGSLST